MDKNYEVIFAPKGTTTKFVRVETIGKNPEEAKDNIRKSWNVNFFRKVNEIPDSFGEIFDLLTELDNLNFEGVTLKRLGG